jgi:hypothetical protein
MFDRLFKYSYALAGWGFGPHSRLMEFLRNL